MENREQKEARLATLKAELLTVEGTPTEVYSRIVGYYRSVRNWNAGKREEFGARKEFSFSSILNNAPELASYRLFERSACPNCPPVHDYLCASGLPGIVVDVDTDDGLELARRFDVLSTPTAIMLGSDGRQIARALTRKQLEDIGVPSKARSLPAAAVTV